jgi:hypothetical protein
MKKLVTSLVAVSILSMPAAAQVRPGDCQPILPVVDKAAEVVPVITPQAPPVIPAAAHRFVGWPFLIPLIPIAACAAFCGGGHHHHTPVSPA